MAFPRYRHIKLPDIQHFTEKDNFFLAKLYCYGKLTYVGEELLCT